MNKLSATDIMRIKQQANKRCDEIDKRFNETVFAAFKELAENMRKIVELN